MTRQRIEKVSREFGGAVKVRCIETTDRQSIAKLGESRKVFVNGKECFLLPPAEDQIRKVFEMGVKGRELEASHA